MPGIEGLVYEPELQPSSQRKHNCEDCFSCQMCSDVRCTVCRDEADSPSPPREGSKKTCRHLSDPHKCAKR